MATITSRLELPYPQGTDANNVPADMGALAIDIDTKMANGGTIASRPSSGLKQGMRYWGTDASANAPMEYRVHGGSWLPTSRTLVDTYANRPSASGIGGVMFWATDQAAMYISDGTNWQRVGTPAGVIQDYGGGTVPTGYLLLYGQNISRSGINTDLFTAWGTQYGNGDGSTTFGVLDSRGRVTAGKDDMGGSSANRISSGNSLGYTVGAQTHVLSSSEMPSHTHVQNAHNHSVTWSQGTPPDSHGLGAGTIAGGPDIVPVGNGITINNATPTNQNTGGGGSHNNMQPTIIVNKMVKL